jgi:hypothetical protein
VEWLEIEDAVKTDVVTQASFEQLEYFELRRQILSALSHSDNVMGSGFRSPNSAINGIGGTVNPSDLFPACKDLEDLGFLKIEMDYQDIEEGPLAAR